MESAAPSSTILAADSVDVPTRTESASRCEAEKRLAVIVVDDDPDVRTMLRTLLELDDREVIEAADGEQAWKMILRYRPAIVVTDIQMPCLDGLAPCRRIRDNGFRHVKLLVYTGRPVTAEDVKRAGAHEHFLKTDPLASLRQTITRLAP